MKKILLLTAFLVAAAFAGAPVTAQTKPCRLGVTINTRYSKAAALDSIMQRYTTAALPGAAMAVYTAAEGWWAGAQGYASLEEKQAMQNCHLQYIQSVSKTYMAVAILQLKEAGRLHLDSPMTKYLPVRYSRYIKNAAAITVRMLLNQTSGVPEYNSHPTFVSQVLMHPADYFSATDCLQSIAGEAPQFTPGSLYRYTNTNYLLLSLIGDALTGDHAAYIKQHIFQPLGLANSYYGKGHQYLNGLYLPASYWDALGVERPANFSRLQQVTVASSKGDDGIVCTPADAVQFLRGLMEGRLLQPATLQEMMSFVKDEAGNKRYGMGLIYFDLGGLPAYGHGGGGVGAGCVLVYIPSHHTYLFLATNLGVLVDGALSRKADEMRTAIMATLLQ